MPREMSSVLIRSCNSLVLDKVSASIEYRKGRNTTSSSCLHWRCRERPQASRCAASDRTEGQKAVDRHSEDDEGLTKKLVFRNTSRNYCTGTYRSITTVPRLSLAARSFKAYFTRVTCRQITLANDAIQLLSCSCRHSANGTGIFDVTGWLYTKQTIALLLPVTLVNLVTIIRLVVSMRSGDPILCTTDPTDPRSLLVSMGKLQEGKVRIALEEDNSVLWRASDGHASRWSRGRDESPDHECLTRLHLVPRC